MFFRLPFVFFVVKKKETPDEKGTQKPNKRITALG